MDVGSRNEWVPVFSWIAVGRVVHAATILQRPRDGSIARRVRLTQDFLHAAWMAADVTGYGHLTGKPHDREGHEQGSGR